MSFRPFHPIAVALALAIGAVTAAPAFATECANPYICVGTGSSGTTGSPAQANTQGDLAMGYGAYAGDPSLDAYNTGSHAIAFGTQSRATGLDGIANGFYATADATGAIAMGSMAHAGDGNIGYTVNPDGSLMFTHGGQVAIGDSSTAVQNDSIALGSSATSTGYRAAALGANSLATGASSVAIGTDSQADQDDTVSFGYVGYARRLVNVGAGIGDTDAVNVSQLYGFANALGGGATWSNGVLTGPSFSLTGGTFGDVGSALTYLDNRISSLPTPDPVTPPPATDDTAVHYDANTKDQATLAGADGTRLSNVADGVAPTDAANVRQVQKAKSEAIDVAEDYADAGDARTLNLAERYADAGDSRVQNWAKSYTDEQAAKTLRAANDYTDMRFRELDERFARAEAMGSAQTSMAANFRGANSVSAGVGFSGGHNAIAVGYRHVTASGHVSFSAHGAIAGSERSLGVGVGYSW